MTTGAESKMTKQHQLRKSVNLTASKSLRKLMTSTPSIFPATLGATEEDATPAPRQRRPTRHLADFVTRATANGSTRSALSNEFVPPPHIIPCRVVRSIHRCVNGCCRSRNMSVTVAQRDDRRDHQTSAEDAGHQRRQPPPTHGKVAAGSNIADAEPPTDMGRDAVRFLQYVMKQPGQISWSKLRDAAAEKWPRLSATARNNMIWVAIEFARWGKTSDRIAKMDVIQGITSDAQVRAIAEAQTLQFQLEIGMFDDSVEKRKAMRLTAKPSSVVLAPAQPELPAATDRSSDDESVVSESINHYRLTRARSRLGSRRRARIRLLGRPRGNNAVSRAHLGRGPPKR